MILYLIRHGKTVGSDEKGRPLGGKGRYVSQEGLEGLREKFESLKEEIQGEDCRAFTSPYYRTRQTAKALHEVFGLPVEARSFREVVQAFYLEECSDEVREQIVCVISHEPCMSRMIWDLVKRNERAPMGSIHKIEIDQ